MSLIILMRLPWWLYAKKTSNRLCCSTRIKVRNTGLLNTFRCSNNTIFSKVWAGKVSVLIMRWQKAFLAHSRMNWFTRNTIKLGRKQKVVSLNILKYFIIEWEDILTSIINLLYLLRLTTMIQSSVQSDGGTSIWPLLIVHERTGRPLGGESFMERVSSLVGRELGKQKPGPKRKDGS